MTDLHGTSHKHPGHGIDSDGLRMLFAGLASIVACTVTHPLDTVKIRLQL